MYIQGMSSCAVQEIVGLSHRSGSDALARMKQFCLLTIGNKADCTPNGGYSAYNYGSHPAGSPNQGNYSEGLGENYVFHGTELTASSEPYGQYASKFADFIEAEKLGTVARGGLRVNHRYHSGHMCQVFIWTVDREAVLAWWEKHKPKQAAVPASAIK